MDTLALRDFYNRKNELAALERAWRHPMPGGQMALVYGRRRIGKTYLLQRYFSMGISGSEPPKRHCYYLAEQTTATAQRLALAEQLLVALPGTGATPEEVGITWNSLFRFVSAQCQDGERFGLILDEFPYLVEQSPELPSVLQAWWDREGRHTRVFVVICGSQLSVMASLGAENSPLFGRFDAGVLRLAPLRYHEVAAFYQGRPNYRIVDTLLMYGAFGGTPRYHALVDRSRSAAEEIVSLILTPGGALSSEVQFLLASERIRDPAPYNAVLGAIASGCTKFGDIQQQTGLERGSLSFCLQTLISLDWVWRETPFGDDTDRRAIYRIADPFLIFWYRFASKLASALQFGDPAQVYADRIRPYLPEYMGRYVFESVCRQWLEANASARLGLEVLRAGRYWSRDGGTEIDLIADLGSGRRLYAECKWSSQKPLGIGAYAELRARTLALPDKLQSHDPLYVLFSIGGYTEDLRAIARSAEARLLLVDGSDLLPGIPP